MKPTIVYILTKLELGGAQKVCLMLARGFAQQGHTVHLITGSEGELLPEAQQLNIQLHCLTSFKREISIGGLAQEVKSFLQILRLLRSIKKNADGNVIVHTHSSKAGIIGRFAAFCVGIKQRIHTVHGFAFTPQQSYLSWLAVWFVEFCASLVTTQFVCVSQMDQATGSRLFPGFARKSQLIRAAIEWDTFIPARRAHTEAIIHIGTIACFKPQKNLIDLLQAFANVHQKYPNTVLEIIGDGIQRPLLESFITEHHLNHAVSLLGWQKDVTQHLSRWDIFALTSLWEGLPCAVIEARRMKLPVISYKTGGIPEVITHMHNGLLYEKHEVNGITQGLLLLIGNKQLRKQLGQCNDRLDEFHDRDMIYRHKMLYDKDNIA